VDDRTTAENPGQFLIGYTHLMTFTNEFGLEAIIVPLLALSVEQLYIQQHN